MNVVFLHGRASSGAPLGPPGDPILPPRRPGVEARGGGSGAFATAVVVVVASLEAAEAGAAAAEEASSSLEGAAAATTAFFEGGAEWSPRSFSERGDRLVDGEGRTGMVGLGVVAVATAAAMLSCCALRCVEEYHTIPTYYVLYDRR
jgi:hypothetical protein